MERMIPRLGTLKEGLIKRGVSVVYYAMSSLDPGLNMRVLNYGFDDGKETPLEGESESYRYRLGMYYHVASAVDLKDKDVLEVSSGRGGGATYIAKHFQPRSVHGVDLIGKAVKFCREYYDVPGLSFSQGDAENLDIEDNSYDVVVNIEASHNYPNKRRFLSEVHRVLKGDGYFLYADYKPGGNIEELKKQVQRSGFRVIIDEDITPNVLSALDKDNLQKLAFINQSIPRIFRRPFLAFAGVKGTHFYHNLQTGNAAYFNLVLQKEGNKELDEDLVRQT